MSVVPICRRFRANQRFQHILLDHQVVGILYQVSVNCLAVYVCSMGIISKLCMVILHELCGVCVF